MMLNLLNLTITIEKKPKEKKSLVKVMEAEPIENKLDRVKDQYLYLNYACNRFL